MSKRKSIDKLIEALKIMRKYETDMFGTHCEHDSFYVFGLEFDDISEEDEERLDGLGFIKSEMAGVDCLLSYRYGSC